MIGHPRGRKHVVVRFPAAVAGDGLVRVGAAVENQDPATGGRPWR
jgi:hypothetical protein